MIVVACQGGLGNQMFQYALYRAISGSRKDVFLDIEFFTPDEKRRFELAEAFELDLREYHEPFFVGALRRVAKRLSSLRQGPLLKRLAMKAASVACNRLAGLYDASFMTVRDLGPLDLKEALAKRRLRFEGYWQSSRYFSGIEEALRLDFRPKSPLPSLAQDYLREIESQASVSVHVRRGDYAASEGAVKRYGGICTRDYYEKAIARIRGNSPNTHFFVFSDDIDWVREQGYFDPPVHHTFIDSRSFPAWVDMVLMSRCEHNIIANSSYSWWASWLNTNPGKRVIAPSRWVNEGNEDRVCDLSGIWESDWELVEA
ncbi:MAG: alpha-1,2-fucosyltransferase [Spirochaetota bacterium]